MLVSVVLINIFFEVNMKLIVGIGNPGEEYESTRHNIGFMIIDNFLGKIKYQEKFNAQYYKKEIDGEIVYFIKPLTYVNNSGMAVRKYMDYFGINIKDILVIQDDLDEDIGKFKLKKHSSSGGHNGIKSIIKYLNSEDFLRLKIGINNKHNDVIDFVLGKFSKKEKKLIEENMDVFIEISNSFIKNGSDKTMNIFNSR